LKEILRKYAMKKLKKNNNLEKIVQRAGVLLNSSKHKEALELLRPYSDRLGDLQIFHNMMGVAQAGLREHDAAVQHFLKSIRLNPLDAMPFAGIANSLAKNLQFEEAAKYYDLALIVDENYHDAIVGLGVINFQRSNYSACEGLFKKALEQKPHSTVVLTNLANSYSVQGRYEDAFPLWDKALKLNPNNPQARMNRGLAGLGMGYFESAWDDYEDRFHEDNFLPQRFQQLPQWPGPRNISEPVLIWVEQGIGDEIMFASMYRELADLSEKFAAECNPRLLEIYRESFPHIFFVPTRSLKDASAFRYQISIASLGRVLRRSKESFAPALSKGAYLKQTVNALDLSTREALANLPKPWIGVSWESYALTMNFRGRKSIPSVEFAEFTKGFKGSFINLQFPNPHKHEHPTPQVVPENVHTLPDLDLKNDLRGLTSLLREMDHVVTIGNSVAHLCGAFGIPTTVLLPSVADWRWGFSGDKSVWYESLELRRNKDSNSWAELLAETKESLFNKYKI
jgi:Flp pilus assembly protein TadD